MKKNTLEKIVYTIRVIAMTTTFFMILLGVLKVLKINLENIFYIMLIIFFVDAAIIFVLERRLKK
ncbi:MAG: hypothetical protein OQK82_03400 [Candidatus Pacearchaeota archaeon]|nr:hypothetical protein [Candidatus Pacearchaeota archaeon]